MRTFASVLFIFLCAAGLLRAQPTVTTAPARRTVLSVGQSVTLSASATGTAPLAFQWKKNGVAIAGATGTSLTLAGVSLGDAGCYTVVVTDGAGFSAYASGFVVVPRLRTQVIAWGTNQSGQTSVPASLSGLSSVIGIAAGGMHSLALKSDGTVVGWGDSTYGQLPVPSGLTEVVAIAAGNYHSLALKADGTVVAWGASNYQQTPVPDGLKNVIAISAGPYASAALLADGSVVRWGGTFSPAPETLPSISSGIAVSLGSTYVGVLKADGSVYVGRPSPPFDAAAAALSDIVAIAMGSAHFLALDKAGAVVALGSNSVGQQLVPSNLGSVKAIAAGPDFSLALRVDGSVAAWGSNTSGQLNAPFGLAAGFAIAASGAGAHAIVVRDWSGDLPAEIVTQPASQTVNNGATATFSVTASGGFVSYQWRKDGVAISGATSPTLTLTNVQAASAGQYSVVVSTILGGTTSNAATLSVNPPPVISVQPTARTVAAAGQPMSLSVVATGANALAYVWKVNGRIIPDETGPSITRTVRGPSDAGYYQVRVIDTVSGLGVTSKTAFVVLSVPDTQVVAWGSNSSGESTIPADVGNAVAVAVGWGNSVVLRADGTVRAWGSNTYGQTSVPAGLTNVVAIASGGAATSASVGAATLALKDDGTVVQFGTIAGGITVAKPTLTNAVAVAVGNSVCMALRADGTVAVWGSSRSFQTEIPASVYDVVAIAAGRYTSYALRSDGVLVEWGSGFSGEIFTDIIAISAGWQHVAVVRSDGSLRSAVNLTGLFSVGSLPDNADGVGLISAGLGWTIATRTNGDVSVWGRILPSSDLGQTNGPFYQMRPHVISVGATHGLALREAAGDTVPVMVQTAASRTVTAGQATTFTAAATGGAMRYQWQRNEVDIAGAIAPTYTIANVQAAQGGSYRVKVSNYLGTTFSEAATLIVQTPFASWQAAPFTADELTTPSISAPTATPAGDGVPNLLKFALGIAPRAAVPADRMTLVASAASPPDGAPEWVFTYRRPQDVVGITYAVETSGDLAAWTTDGVVHERQSAADSAGLETWTARRAATPPPSSATAPLFFRLKVMQP